MNVTYIPMARGFVYLAAVVDWFSRRVLSWRMSITMEASFCVETLEKALTKHGKPEIFNTDQGASLQESCSRMFCDEALVKAGVNELVLVASEAGGRVRLAHVENNDTETCKLFAAGQVATDAHVVTDGHAGYNKKSLDKRPHDAVVQTKAERHENDAVQGCHWTISLLKRWLHGTHAGAVRDKHLQAYLDEFAFRHNRRKTKGVGRIAARVIESLVARPPRTMRMLVDETKRRRWYGSVQRTA